MDWNASTWWWVATGVLVACEMATGTFYLLMVAMGAAAGAVTAHAGLGITTQMVAAALLAVAATTAWHLKRAKQPGAAPAASNRDVNLDIGQSVHVRQWSNEATAHVQYRGARWSVRYAGPGTPAPGTHVIVALDGNELRVAPQPHP